MDIYDQVNQSKYVFYFLVVDNFLDIQLPQLKNFHLIYSHQSPVFKDLKQNQISFFCLENAGVNLSEKNSGRLISQPEVVEYIKTTSKNLQPVIIPFKPSAKIEIFCKKNNWICAAVSHSLNRFLEDKNEFLLFCQKHKLPCIPAIIDKLNQKNFKKYQHQFGQKLVIQTHFGWAGKSTFFASKWDEIKDIIAPETQVKFSPFLSGYSLLNNCCLTQNGLIQSPVALQYTGIQPLTTNPFTTVGRQWPSTAPKKIEDQIKKITQDFSKIVQTMGYKGFFGLDFIVDQDQVYLLECNPRLTASFAFYTQIEINNSLIPLFLLHLLQFIDIATTLNTTQIQKQLDQADIVGSEITRKNSDSQTIAKYHDFIQFAKQNNPINIPSSIINLLYEEK